MGIPLFDFNDYEKDKEGFAKAFGEAFRQFGFVRLINHGIPEAVLEDADKASRGFYSLPLDVKEQYEAGEWKGLIGYSRNAEIARGKTEVDKKEEFSIRARLGDDHPFASKLDSVLNIKEYPDYYPAMMTLFKNFEEATLRVMRPISLYMGMDENWFDDKFDKSHSMMRPIYYPNGGTAANHLDLNFLTWLRAEKPGLFVTDRSGVEHEVVAGEGELLLNGGMQLGLLTNEDLKPSWHRVDAPDPRYTIVFFVHPNPDFKLKPLGRFENIVLGADETPDYFPAANENGKFEISVADFVQQEISKIFG
ncbi:MAG: 2-oxoglutarate and iron-dependent oxygenase domain-containing protein [Pseudomonadota bacterium]|jgi:isopenicillin N synthase-like dioxygenase|nr:2-oxoglutarate and iron-dependent oxygenase domain-containing protein [Pseudomonadota bacterium]MEC7703057.1 2-oxoglutarate and iron-dependent oxygenase domain-containing protein [Pseudomonadota bacterium]